MSSPRATNVTRWADAVPLPWKNGSGLTRELAASRTADALGTFDWRVSVADVTASGDFSDFAGVDRIIVFVEGQEMTLTIGKTTHRLTRCEPFSFSGDARTVCGVPCGPTRDLNIMTRRDRFRAAVEVIDIRERATRRMPSGTAVHLLIPIRGRLDAIVDQGEKITLRSYDVLRVRSAATVELYGTAHAACVNLSPLAGGQPHT